MSQRKRWDVSKRYLKHSELFFQTPTEQIKPLIERYLKAFKEVLPAIEVIYFYGDKAFQLEKNRLVVQANPPKQLDWAVLSILSKASTRKHRVVYHAVKLNDEKQQFLTLITEVYRAKLESWLKKPEGMESQSTAQDAGHPKSGSLKARYRRQKEVILAIERFAKRQSPGLLKEISELPELEEEIINFQNQLLNDLEQARLRSSQVQEKLISTELFFGSVLDELANKLRISQGLLDLLPQPSLKDSSEFQPLSLVGIRLRNLTDFTESLTQSLEAQAHLPTEKNEKFSVLQMVHQALSDFGQVEGTHNCQFKFNQTLDRCHIMGDCGALALGMIRLFQFAISLQEYETSPHVLAFKITGKSMKEEVQLRIEVSGLQLSKKLKELISPLGVSFDQSPAGFVIPLAMQQIITRTFGRYGSVTFLVRESGRLDINIKISHPQ